MGTYFSIPYIPKRAVVVEVSTVKCETPASVPTLVAADLKTEAEPKIRIPLTDMETAITKEVDQLLDQKREPDESKKAIEDLLIMVEDMQKIIEPKVEEPKVEPKVEKVEPKVEEKEEKVVVEKVEKAEKVEPTVEKVEKVEPKVEEPKEEPKVEPKEEKVEKKEEPKEKKSEYKEVLKDLLRATQSKNEPTLPVIMEEPVVEPKLSIIIPSSSPIDPPRIPEMNKKKKNKK